MRKNSLQEYSLEKAIGYSDFTVTSRRIETKFKLQNWCELSIDKLQPQAVKTRYTPELQVPNTPELQAKTYAGVTGELT